MGKRRTFIVRSPYLSELDRWDRALFLVRVIERNDTEANTEVSVPFLSICSLAAGPTDLKLPDGSMGVSSSRMCRAEIL